MGKILHEGAEPYRGRENVLSVPGFEDGRCPHTAYISVCPGTEECSLIPVDGAWEQEENQ